MATTTIENLTVKKYEGERHDRHAWFVAIKITGERGGSFEELETEDQADEYIELLIRMAEDFRPANHWEVQDLRDAVTDRFRLSY